MKKLAAVVLCILLSLSLAVPAFGATAGAKVSEDQISAIVAAMDITSYDPEKSYEAGQAVTRGELAKILVKASSYKELALTESKISPFGDVPYTHTYATYISIASAKGILTPYSSGNFKPDQEVLYEEAVTAALKLLGYAAEDFIGGYPMGQLSIADSKGLLDGIDCSTGQVMSKENIAYLIYNTLCAAPKDSADQTYGETLGYSIANGVLTLGDIRSLNLKGPITVKSLDFAASLGLSDPTVFIDGDESILAEIELYDIVYYNLDNNLLLAYTEHEEGRVLSISPNRESPTSVTIDDQTYELSTYAAREAFSLGGLGVEDYVTVLFDRNGDVADAYPETD